MNKTNAKKYLSAIKTSKKKCLTSEALSRYMGIYPEVINRDLSEFYPMLALDPSYNLRDLIPNIEAYIAEQEANKPAKTHKKIKKTAQKYSSIGDFVYKKMTIGGLVDKNANLDETDLKVLRKLIDEQLEEIKQK